MDFGHATGHRHRHSLGEKVTPRDRRASMLTGQRKAKWRKLHSDVAVARTGGSGNKAFEACVVIGGGRIGGGLTAKYNIHRAGPHASGYTTSCMFGRNPREALKHALQRAVRQFGKRRGAFARY